ncbi:HWE histidine kinase domain-containing protein [Roseomonas sp. CCTCC AB2023176]|uniref:HWE histidine kinase domain-containing protein n=1 Tax=Roseomonas sp. CCTCC AB2023176 TaxID=3342640 RepID=UPI0035DE9CF9
MADALEVRTEALRGSEEWLRLAQEAGGVGAWEWDVATGVARWSDGQFALLGLDPATYGQPTVDRFREVIHPEDRDRAAAAATAATRTGVMEAEFRILRRAPDGMEEVRWLAARGRARRDAMGRITHVVGVNVDVTARHDAEDRQRVLMREVDHRAKNALTVVQATLRLTPKDDAAAYARAVEGRVRALARAQTLLAEGRWEGVSLREVAAGELDPFLPEGGASRIILDGPAVTLAANAVQPLAMALHELATNATKHGALSVPGGTVRLGWMIDGDRLRLHWEESGGPPSSRRRGQASGPASCLRRSAISSRDAPSAPGTPRGWAASSRSRRLARWWRPRRLRPFPRHPPHRGPHRSRPSLDAGA